MQSGNYGNHSGSDDDLSRVEWNSSKDESSDDNNSTALRTSTPSPNASSMLTIPYTSSTSTTTAAAPSSTYLSHPTPPLVQPSLSRANSSDGLRFIIIDDYSPSATSHLCLSSSAPLIIQEEDAPATSSRSSIQTNSELPIFRLEAGINPLDLPHPLFYAICNLLHIRNLGEMKIYNWENDEDNRKHYINRIEAIYAGIEFLLQSNFVDYFKHGPNLIYYFRRLTNACAEHMAKLKINDINILQSSLANYLDAAVAILSSELDLDKDLIMLLLSRAEEFALALKTKPAVCTISRISGLENEFAVNIDCPENPFTDKKLIQELQAIQQTPLSLVLKKDEKTLPSWFTILKPYEKHLIHFFLKQIDIESDLGTRINALSSKLRLIPAPSNYGMHTLITWMTSYGEKTPKLTIHPPELRSSHTASRDVAKHKDAVRDRHVVSNIQCEALAIIRNKLAELETTLTDAPVRGTQIIVPILFQTLITPIKAPDSALESDRERNIEAIQQWLRSLHYTIKGHEIIFDFYFTNHPLNYGKYLKPTTTSTLTGKEIEALLSLIKTRRNRLHITNPRLLECASELLSINWPQLKIFTSYRELYIASLSQLVVAAAGGASMGSCVSGKDRKAIEIAHTDAMHIFFERYHTLPPMEFRNKVEEGRMEIFANIFAEIYCTKHQPFLAEQNAPGSFGTKTPSMYLPAHLIAGIKKWYVIRDGKQVAYADLSNFDILKQSDKMASNNDLSHIKSSSTKNPKLVWAPPKFAHTDVYTLTPAHIIEVGKSAINNYLHDAQRENKLGLLARTFDSDRGQLRATALKQLMNSITLSLLQKKIILTALIMNYDGENLKLSMVHAFGFASEKSLRNILLNHLVEKLNPTPIDQIKKLLANINEHLNDISGAEEITRVIDTVSALVRFAAPLITTEPSISKRDPFSI